MREEEANELNNNKREEEDVMPLSREVAAILGLAAAVVAVSVTWFRLGGDPVWLTILAGAILVVGNARRLPFPTRNAAVVSAAVALVAAVVAAVSGHQTVAYALTLAAMMIALWII